MHLSRDDNWDIVVLEILLPILAITIAYFLPISDNFSVDTKLSIIVLGISGSIVSLQLCLNKMNKSLDNLETLKSDINHLSPVLEKVTATKNEDLQRFAFQRLKKTYESIESAITNNDSGDLSKDEYYQELFHFSDLIMKDKDTYKKRFAGEIWAMTAFAKNEWTGHRANAWTERLKHMTSKGITTKRLCLMNNQLYKLIEENKDEDNQQLSEFKKFLEVHYKNGAKTNCVEHYIMREEEAILFQERSIKSFFAIKLTDGTMHFLSYEAPTGDFDVLCKAKVLCDKEKIKKLRRNFDIFAINNNKISKKDEFRNFLKEQGINISGEQ